MTPIDSISFRSHAHCSGADTKSSTDGVYNVPEYFQYDELSYYDLDIDMLKYRLKQPKPGEKY